ncbi:MAG: TIGR04283 family arsenosugar biosynthesis glycosyltransferase [Aerococcus sp.]|nr:TIGR04283 family arsenosugar biosynthesis glycosyltransferase [Aerococcus sp.]
MISIIIPVKNEAQRLPQLLEQLRSWEDGPQHEVIFVDGGSQDETVSFVQVAGYAIYHTMPGRGSQLQYGVQQSQGERLFFLYADSQFQESPLPLIERTCQTEAFGCFRLHYETTNPVLKAISWGANWRVRYRHIAFGDQGMFMTREAYKRVGGFHSLPLMEDYDLSLRARDSGIHCQLVEQTITSSTRYFEQHGALCSLYRMQKCQWLFRHGAAIERIQAEYQR